MKKITNYLIIISIILLIIFKIKYNNIYIIYSSLISYISIVLVLISSAYFIIKLKLVNINIIKIIKTIKECKKEDILALLMSLGAKIGIGSIAGTSIAIYTNGPGVLLWIWIIALISSILTYCETYLGSKYKNKGIFYYIKDGLNNKELSIIYTLILIVIYEVGFVGIQSNTIYKSINELNIINNKLLIIILLFIISIFIISDIKELINNTSKIVGLMCIVYILITFPLLLKIKSIKEILNLIIKDGLNNNKLPKIIIAGLQRGIFATESGIGTSSLTTSISNNKPEKQALFQVIGVHFITIVIISITGIIIIDNNSNYIGPINGIEILMSIFNTEYGFIGKIILCIIIILFALSTIISSYYFTIKGIKYITNTKKNYKLIIKVILLTFALIGMIIKSSIIWSIIDDLILYLLIINTYTIIKLRKEIE